MKTDVNFYRKPAKRERFLSFYQFLAFNGLLILALVIYAFVPLEHRDIELSASSMTERHDQGFDQKMAIDTIERAVYQLSAQEQSLVNGLIEDLQASVDDGSLQAIEFDASSKQLVFQLSANSESSLTAWLAMLEQKRFFKAWSVINLKVSAKAQAWYLDIVLYLKDDLPEVRSSMQGGSQ